MSGFSVDGPLEDEISEIVRAERARYVRRNGGLPVKFRVVRALNAAEIKREKEAPLSSSRCAIRHNPFSTTQRCQALSVEDAVTRFALW